MVFDFRSAGSRRRLFSILAGLFWLVVANPAAALVVTVAFRITHGSIALGPNAGATISSGSLSVTWPNATTPYYDDLNASAIVDNLTLKASGVGTFTLQHFSFGKNQNLGLASIGARKSGGYGCCEIAGAEGNAPSGQGIWRAGSFYFFARGPASSPRTFLKGRVNVKASTGFGELSFSTLSWEFTGTEVGRTPEPGSASLLGLGLAALGACGASRGITAPSSRGRGSRASVHPARVRSRR